MANALNQRPEDPKNTVRRTAAFVQGQQPGIRAANKTTEGEALDSPERQSQKLYAAITAAEISFRQQLANYYAKQTRIIRGPRSRFRARFRRGAAVVALAEAPTAKSATSDAKLALLNQLHAQEQRINYLHQELANNSEQLQNLQLDYQQFQDNYRDLLQTPADFILQDKLKNVKDFVSELKALFAHKLDTANDNEEERNLRPSEVKRRGALNVEQDKLQYTNSWLTKQREEIIVSLESVYNEHAATLAEAQKQGLDIDSTYRNTISASQNQIPEFKQLDMSISQLQKDMTGLQPTLTEHLVTTNADTHLAAQLNAQSSNLRSDLGISSYLNNEQMLNALYMLLELQQSEATQKPELIQQVVGLLLFDDEKQSTVADQDQADSFMKQLNESPLTTTLLPDALNNQGILNQDKQNASNQDQDSSLFDKMFDFLQDLEQDVEQDVSKGIDFLSSVVSMFLQLPELDQSTNDDRQKQDQDDLTSKSSGKSLQRS